MKILVCGSGPLGSLFAARLPRGGHDVTLLARGQRLEQLRQWGIVLHDVQTDEWETVRSVTFTDRLAPDDAYDLALVVMRKNQALELLPALAANQQIPHVLFMMNNAAGPAALVEALGYERVLLGFPTSAGYRDEYVMHVLAGRPGAEYTLPIGEVDGHISARTEMVAAALGQMPGFTVAIRTDMDTWLKYHVALLMPSLAAAFYAAGMDRTRLLATPDALLLGVRALREGFAVLEALGYPVTPSALRPFKWLPEPVIIPLLRRRLSHPLMEVAIASHARAGRDEITLLVDEFRDLARQTGVVTPAIDRLYPYLAGDAPLIPAGSRELPLDWRPVYAGALAVAGAVAGLVLLAGLIRGRGPDRPARA